MAKADPVDLTAYADKDGYVDGKKADLRAARQHLPGETQ
jgi:hypothetical protein